jgi:hypothetical protein
MSGERYRLTWASSFYSIVLQKIKISMLVFNAIKFTYLLLDKTFPVKK